MKLSPTAPSSFLPPPSAILWFSHWSAVGLENRPRAIANASIFGHVDGTRGTRLSHNPPSKHPPTPPSIHPTHPSFLLLLCHLLTSSFLLFITSCLSSLPNQTSHDQIKRGRAALKDGNHCGWGGGGGGERLQCSFGPTGQLSDPCLPRFWRFFSRTAVWDQNQSRSINTALQNDPSQRTNRKTTLMAFSARGLKCVGVCVCVIESSRLTGPVTHS